MKRAALTIILIVNFFIANCQDATIKEMTWGLEQKISLVLSNDSTYVMNIDDLYATNQKFEDPKLTYYPVKFEEGYIKVLKDKNSSEPADTSEQVHENLWRALNSVLSGGWAHFLNCALYALETQQLSLTAEEMERPDTDWKPKPMTDTYKRTKKWEYYIPVNQKNAIKEYKRKQKNDQLADLEGIPREFLDLFLDTKHKEYEDLKEYGNHEKAAKIDLVKLLLGSNYLGKEQIEYIKKRILEAAIDYSIYELPSIIIFNNFNAAVAMTMDEEGYKIDAIEFSMEEELSDVEKENRRENIRDIVDNINKANQKAIEKKLKSIYN